MNHPSNHFPTPSHHFHISRENFPYLPEGQQLTTPQNKEYTASLMSLERAMQDGIILEGMVTLCDADFCLHIDLPQIPHVHAIIPKEEAVYQLDGDHVKDIAILTRVGKAVCFKVLGIELYDGIPHVTLSRRAAQVECVMQYLSTITPGDIIPARVTHMEPFGAFVDIGCGIPALLSVDAISVSRISHPADRLRQGQYIWTVVRSKALDGCGLPKRIFVSTKELLGTWEENVAGYHSGQTVVGILRSIEEYGAFVELSPNLTGLAEIKDATSGGKSPKMVAREMIGKPVAVFIKSIQPDRMKIKLVLIDGYVDTISPTTTSNKLVKDTSTPTQLPYFIDGNHTSHISRWRYSPTTATRRVESVFDGDEG